MESSALRSYIAKRTCTPLNSAWSELYRTAEISRAQPRLVGGVCIMHGRRRSVRVETFRNHGVDADDYFRANHCGSCGLPLLHAGLPSSECESDEAVSLAG